MRADLSGQLGDATGETDVPCRHAARVVARETNVEVRVAQVEIRVVVRLLSRFADEVHETQTGGEVAGAKASPKRVVHQPPVGEVRFLDLGGAQGGITHE